MNRRKLKKLRKNAHCIALRGTINTIALLIQYSLDDLLNLVQASEKEIWDALEKLGAIAINGEYMGSNSA